MQDAAHLHSAHLVRDVKGKKRDRENRRGQAGVDLGQCTYFSWPAGKATSGSSGVLREA